MGGVGDRIEIRDPRRGDENVRKLARTLMAALIEIRDPRRGDENDIWEILGIEETIEIRDPRRGDENNLGCALPQIFPTLR